MDCPDYQTRRQLEQLDRCQLAEHQRTRLNRLLRTILPENGFYREKLAGIALPLESLDALGEFPFTTKNELSDASSGEDLATNRTWAVDHYVRFHRTSGTHGRPLVVLDTAEDWQWWVGTWQFVLDAARVTATDRVMMAFSFGPFIGFWSAYDALVSRGAMVIPGGGMSTLARLELIARAGATVLCCTPTYALHMADAASDQGMDLARSAIRCLIVAGEPGGSLPAVCNRLQAVWGAEVIDHAGATEIGPWGYANTARSGLHVVESEFIAEFFSIASGKAAADGELSELVLTTLGRFGSPVIRYRTGDLVRPVRKPEGANRFVLLEGGVIGRTDDMMIIRGVNVFPSSVEQVLRGFEEVGEFRLTACKQGEMDSLCVEVEDRLNEPERIARQLHLQLGLRTEVRCVPPGSLPRFEGKSERFVDER